MSEIVDELLLEANLKFKIAGLWCGFGEVIFWRLVNNNDTVKPI